MTEINLAELSAEFPRNAVSWRAQTLTKAGDKALALAYIDARDVMDRLDQVCGADNWQDRYEFHGARTVCYLSLRINGEWITKADGAGDSDVEAEKGAISDALKRAAVKWGIGRYLYSIISPWVPCETYESNGKKHWKSWSADPWSCVRNAAPAPAPAKQSAPAAHVTPANVGSLTTKVAAAKTEPELQSVWRVIESYGEDELSQEDFDTITAVVNQRLVEIKAERKAPPKNLGEHLDRLQAQEANPN